MAKFRRVIRKSNISRPESFESQLWPVVVALCLLGGAIAGAAITFFQGPELWISLLSIPIGLSLAVFVLSRINNKFLRRSLQFAFIISLFVHVIILVTAFFTGVMSSPRIAQTSQPKMVKRKTIDRPVEFPTEQWDELNEIETPAPDERLEEQTQEQPNTTTERPQPIPVEDQQQVKETAMERKDVPATTTPRASEELSKLSRHTANDSPTSSESADTAVASNRTQSDPQANPDSTVERQSPTANNQRTASSSQTAENSPTNSAVAQARRNNDTSSPVESALNEQRRSQSNATVAESQVTPVQNPTPSRAVAKSDATNIQQQNAQATNQRAEANVASAATATQAASSPTRRATESPLPTETTIAQTNSPTPDRRGATARPDVTPSEATVPNQATTVANSAEPSLNSLATASQQMSVQQQSSNPGTVQRTSDSPQPTTTTAEARTAASARRETAENNPQVALATSGSARRQANQEVPQNVSADTQSVASANRASRSEIAPSDARVSQSTSRSSQSRAATSANMAEEGNVAQVARPNARRESSTDVPSATPLAESSGNPRRTIATSETPVSSAVADSPGTARTANSLARSNEQPQAMALSQGQTGVAGRGQSQNMDNDVSTAERPAVAASAAARREKSTQANQTGDSILPAEITNASRSQADSRDPSSSVAATTADLTNLAGAQRESPRTASSAASVMQSKSDLPTGDVSALRSTTEVDTGSPKVVSEELTGRGSGGGNREISPNQDPTATGTSRRAAANASVASAEFAENSAAPVASGAGRPQPTTSTLESPSQANSIAGRANSPAAKSSASEAADTDVAASLGKETGNPSVARAARNNSGAESSSSEATDGGADGAANRRDQQGADVVAMSSVETGETSRGSSAPTTVAEGGAIASVNTPQKAGTSRAESGAGTAANVDTGPSLRASQAEMAGSNQQGRSERRDAIAGNLDAGGGTAGTRRVAGNEGLPTGQQADIGTAGSETKTASTNPSAEVGGVAAASGATSARTSAGSEVEADTAMAGAPSAGKAGRRSGELDGAPTDTSVADGATRTRRAAAAGADGTVEIAGANAADGTAGKGRGGPARSGPGDLEVAKQSVEGGIKSRVRAEDGPGGLGSELTETAGLNDRRARMDDAPIQASVETRFPRTDAGGTPSINTAAALASEAYREREAGRKRKGAPSTEESIELGLRFIAKYQTEEGKWRLEEFGTGQGDSEDERSIMKSDTAATGLAILAFQGAGYNHIEYQYAGNVKRGIDWLVANQASDGSLYVESDAESSKSAKLYSHAIAALALCEAYGVTQDPALKQPAQKALDYIIKTQDAEAGGWRYTPGRGADTSVTGWMMMALKSGGLAGLEIKPEAYINIEKWLGQALDRESGSKYRYNPLAPASDARVSHGRVPTHSMTAVGMLMQLYMGKDRTKTEMKAGADFLLEQLPSDETSVLRDTYYWYYATQVLRHMDGDYWQKWNEKLHPLLVNSQVKTGAYAGSWDPLKPTPDRWSRHGGRLYLTTMNLLSLEVDYRLLPLYDSTVGRFADDKKTP